MLTQLALSFDDVPVTCEVQQRYHSIAPCLAGISTPAEQAQALNLGYSTVTRWLREFREQGMPGLFPQTQYPREPYILLGSRAHLKFPIAVTHVDVQRNALCVTFIKNSPGTRTRQGREKPICSK